MALSVWCYYCCGCSFRAWLASCSSLTTLFFFFFFLFFFSKIFIVNWKKEEVVFKIMKKGGSFGGETLPTLFPPAKFGIVEPQIYRSNQLYPINFPFIQQLKIKTVIRLSPGKISFPARCIDFLYASLQICPTKW